MGYFCIFFKLSLFPFILFLNLVSIFMTFTLKSSLDRLLVPILFSSFSEVSVLLYGTYFSVFSFCLCVSFYIAQTSVKSFGLGRVSLWGRCPVWHSSANFPVSCTRCLEVSYLYPLVMFRLWLVWTYWCAGLPECSCLLGLAANATGCWKVWQAPNHLAEGLSHDCCRHKVCGISPSMTGIEIWLNPCRHSSVQGYPSPHHQGKGAYGAPVPTMSNIWKW